MENLENEEVTIVFGDLSEKNGNLNNGLVAEDLAAALGVESSSSDGEKISEEKNESSVEQRLDELEQLITMMQIQREQRRREDQEEAARRMEISERRAAEDRILLERLTNKTKILEVKVGSQGAAISECEEKILFLETQNTHNTITIRDIENRVDDLEKKLPESPIQRSSVTMRKSNMDTKIDESLSEVKLAEVTSRLDQVESSTELQGELLDNTRAAVDSLYEKVERFERVSEDLQLGVYMTTQALEKLTKKGVVSENSEADEEDNPESEGRKLFSLEKDKGPLSTRMAARRVRESIGTNPPETVFSSADLRGEDTESKGQDQGVQVGMIPSPSHLGVRFLEPSSTMGSIATPKMSKKYVMSGGDDDPDDPDDDRKKRRKDEDSDEDDHDQRKKKGLTRDYLDNIQRTPLLTSPAEVMARMAATPGTGGFPAYPYYTPYVGMPGYPMPYAGGPMHFPGQIVMREKPTIDKLCLSKLDVPRLLLFREKFIRLLQANYPEQLLMTHYMDSRVMSMLVTTIKTEDKFEHLWERVKFLGGVIQADHQLLSNQEVYNVLTYIVRPKSRLEMNKWLGQSVWDSVSYAKFKNNRSYIQTYMDYYLHAWTHYRERFELLVDILCHGDTKQYFPIYVKRKNGTNGLVDYFINGTPDPQFSRQVSEQYIPSDKYEDIKEFPEYLDKHFKALKTLRDRNKLVEDTVSIFKTDKRNIFTPPVDLEYSKGKSVTFKKSERVHAVREHVEDLDDEEELMFPEDDDTMSWELPPDDDRADSKEAWEDDPATPEEQSAPVEEKTADPYDSAARRQEGQDDSWLAGVRYSPDRPAVCFQFARDGRCDRLEKTGSCKYSHDAEDVRKFNAASVLGREGIESIAKGVRQRQQGNSPGRNQQSQNSFERTHTDMNPKPPSQGARSIYKRPSGAVGSGRRS